MKKDIADKWIEALRSDRYEQGKHKLRSLDNKYCCLGVLCDLYIQDVETEEWETGSLSYKVQGADLTVPQKIMDWSGLKYSSGAIPNLKTSLTIYNDVSRVSFKDIADIIEMHWEEL